MSIDLGYDKPKPRRRQSTEVADRVAVRRALAEVVDEIQALQHEAVLLRTLTARSPSPQAHLPRVVTLGQNLRGVSEKFDEVVRTLEERQREHSVVRDLRRTLEILTGSVPRLSV